MNPVVHFTVPAKNYKRAKKFYQDLFGWKISEWPGGDVVYGLAVTTPTGDKGPTKPGAINGGISGPGGQKVVSMAIDVPSIDTFLKKIKANGGKAVSKKMPVGKMGFMAKFKDPEGNEVDLWETAKQ